MRMNNRDDTYRLGTKVGIVGGVIIGCVIWFISLILLTLYNGTVFIAFASHHLFLYLFLIFWFYTFIGGFSGMIFGIVFTVFDKRFSGNTYKKAVCLAIIPGLIMAIAGMPDYLLSISIFILSLLGGILFAWLYNYHKISKMEVGSKASCPLFRL